MDEAGPDKQSSSNRRRAPANAAADGNQDDQRSRYNMDVLDDAGSLGFSISSASQLPIVGESPIQTKPPQPREHVPLPCTLACVNRKLSQENNTINEKSKRE